MVVFAGCFDWRCSHGPSPPPLTCVLWQHHSRIILVFSGGCSVGKLIIVHAEFGGFSLMLVFQYVTL